MATLNEKITARLQAETDELAALIRAAVDPNAPISGFEMVQQAMLRHGENVKAWEALLEEAEAEGDLHAEGMCRRRVGTHQMRLARDAKTIAQMHH
jgi:hypothetical protein